MPKIKLTDYIAKRLRNVYGIQHFFMVSGGGAMHLNDSLGRYIDYTANHHEQACAIAAEGYARVSQKLAVVNVTTGPGGLNCLNGVFGQWTDSVPVLYISGQVKCATRMQSCTDISLRQLGDQEVDIISIVKPITKFAMTLTEPNEIKYYLDKAVYTATQGRNGPVWLDIPIDLQAAIIDEDELKDFIPNISEEHCNQSNIVEIFEKLKKAQYPLIVAGHGIKLSMQTDIFKEISNTLNIPIVTTFSGMDLLDTNDKNFVGRIGTIGQRAGNFALQNADFILFLGTRNNIRQISYNWKNFAKKAFKVVVDIDKAELLKPTIQPDMPICTNLKEFLPMMKQYILQNPKCTELQINKWLNFCKNLKKKFSFENEYEQLSLLKPDSDKINPYIFVRKLTEQMCKNDILVMANGSACVCTHQTAVVKSGQKFILNSGNASMGYAIPAAIGACIANNYESVICLEGDGSIMMNLQELQTIKHNALPIKIFVLNNNGYSSIRQTQRNFFDGHMTGSGVESGVSVPDFINVGKSFELKTVKINSLENLEQQIQNVLNEKGAVLCEVMLTADYTFAPKLSARKLEDGTMVSPSLEDMSPFLNREDYEEIMNEL